MSLGRAEVEQVATILTTARATVISCDPPTTRFPELSIADAYAISRFQFEQRLARGREQDTGRKIGLTSAAHRERYRTSEPSFGYLTDKMRIQDHLSRKTVFTPQAEGEVIFFLGRDLDVRDVTPEEFIAAVDHIRLGIEITDRRIGSPPYKIQDHISDNAFSCAYVLGTEKRSAASLDFAAVRVVGAKNGVEETSGVGSDLMGSPVHSATWLVNRLFKAGEPLRAGQLIFSGSFGPPIPFQQGDVLTYSSAGFGSVALTCKD